MDASYIRIGVDLGGTKIEAIALDDRGQELRRQRVATPRGSYDATIDAVRALVESMEAGAQRRAQVGIGIPGSISPKTGLVRNANATWLIGRPLSRDMSNALERMVLVANDANCFAVSEASDGAAAGAQTVFAVILGTGVGGGLVVDGHLVVGCNSIAGEWGHNPLLTPEQEAPSGRACYCGRENCIETYLSGPSLAREFASRTGRSMEAPQIALAADAGDTDADGILTTYERRLARALAAVINIVDPDVIVLGGGLSNIGRLYENVPAFWRPFVFSDVVSTRLVPAAHGDSSGVRGAAWLWPPSVAPGS